MPAARAPPPHLQVKTTALKTDPLLIFRVFTATFRSLVFFFWLSTFLLLTQLGFTNGGTGDNGVIQKGESVQSGAWADR